MKKEIELRRVYNDNETIKTIYFGGGTPSILAVEQIETILRKIQADYLVEKNPEITIEVNPNDITEARLQAYLRLGINRLSIGVQSFFDEDLAFLGRVHNADQVLKSIEYSLAAGFSNISIDLIYGIPGLNSDRWYKSIMKTVELNIPHISCYGLTVEEKTKLHHDIASGKVQQVNEDHSAMQFEMLVETLNNYGYEHYEISNFSLNGYHSRHNSSYWTGENYIGIGPSAHSYDGELRQWNVANNINYINSLEKNVLPSRKEKLSAGQKYNEYVMTGLRTSKGCDLDYIERKFGDSFRKHFENEAMLFMKDDMVLHEGNVSLTIKGQLLADKISANLFVEY